jgi:hypothetical protein
MNPSLNGLLGFADFSAALSGICTPKGFGLQKTAESNFYVKLSRNQVQLMFQIGLHIDDLPLLTYLKDKLQCGYITQNSKEAKANFVISDQSALLGLLIPIFDSFQLNTTKYLDYLAFRDVVLMCSTKAHLTEKGKEGLWSLKLQ